MALKAGDRIAMIRESATLLDKQEWSDIDLVLDQHGMPTSDFNVPDTKSGYVKEMIKRADDEALTELHRYLTGEIGGRQPGKGPWSSNRLRLFFSHLAVHRSAVGTVGDALSRFGIEPFVAHNSIEPSREWLEVIEAALSDCDAMVVFLHPGFNESVWCDQEVGWALGRNRPMLPLNYGIHPYGFIGKYQDQPCVAARPGQVSTFIMDWLVKTPSLHGRLAPGLVDAFVNSGSWNFTRSVIALLDQIDTVTNDDLDRMVRASEDNVDISDCAVPGDLTGPEWTQQYVRQRRGPTSPPIWPASSGNEPVF